ncbi:hypothetical protein WOLCODRAFT_136153 [Wolfiporia cocos MD-104 SS10]|uniref:N-acetylglucosamine kinase n=1 Tax=Wolfiporia cocos (strain MD-104) TaxID=742152 RepID=A0A2H3J7U7_WOLCO|nr:hypothetical protein WOLCODRAFT_136153 [Wolfiporia cocos MD-104 SS10]
MPLFLCIDCGGSKAAAVIANQTGEPVGRALGGPSNFAYLGLAPFLAVIQETVEKALRACDPAVLRATLPHYDSTQPLALPPSPGKPIFAAAWLGVSGCDSPAAIAKITTGVEALLGIQPRVANDTHLLAAPMTLYPEVNGAIAAVAGTGGIVVSFREPQKDARGEGGETGSAGSVALEELGRVGGWGWILGDEGGGFHVGREAIRQVLEEADRASVKPKTAEPQTNGAKTKVWGLKNRLLQRFGIDDVFELLTVVHLPDPLPTSPPTTASPSPAPESPSSAESNPVLFPREKRLSSLSPLVFTAAFNDHDPLALKVLKVSSSALVDQICVLLRLEEHAPDGERTIRASESILCLGGSLSGIDAYRALILEELERRGHVFRRVQVIDDAAAVGAKALAVASRS